MLLAVAIVVQALLLVSAGAVSAVFTVKVLSDRRQRRDLVQTLTDESRRLAEANEHLRLLTTHDPLTGLANRRGVIDRLDDALSASAGSGRPVAALFLDVDRFKSINDSLGHACGDQLLQVVARRLTSVSDDEMLAGRLGGDEFVVVLSGDVTDERALEVARRLARSLGEPLELAGRLVRVSTSIGLAISDPVAIETAGDLLNSANTAMHRAKAAGRDRIEVFTPDVRAEMQRRSGEERMLRRSIDNGDVVPVFQPEFDAATGQLVGAEVLARWVRRDGTIANAGEMLSMAEDASTLERLTAVMMQQARPVMRRLGALGLPARFRFRVNLPHRCSPRAWRDGQVPAYFTGIDPHLLVLDVYETGVSDDLPGAAGVLAELRQQGMRICLEDAGRNGAALSLLRSLPLDEIRVDRSHVDTITSHANDRAVVRAMVGLAHDLGLAVSADGVETAAQADALLAIGCQCQQGHLWASPMTADSLEELIVRHAFERAVSSN
ncbi:MAG: putative bifunctional diguanylate cyclase/phosphodiesterase [Ilumatobacteraceae bacterium]